MHFQELLPMTIAMVVLFCMSMKRRNYLTAGLRMRQVRYNLWNGLENARGTARRNVFYGWIDVEI